MKVSNILNKLNRQDQNLSQRAITSGIWIFLLRAVQQLFGLTRLVILARILAPQDFGLMGIALLVMATLETFSQTGFQQALIQKKQDIESYLNSVWTFLILRGLAIFTILYITAPYAATFFDAPNAKPIIQVIGLSVIFDAFSNIGIIYFQKELEFNKQFTYQLAGTLTDFTVAIIAVIILGNVWALVLGKLAGNIALLIASYLLHPYRPHFNVDIQKVRELSNYGKWIFGSTILVYLLTQGDDIIVGRILGVTALGYYQLAYKLSNLPATEITKIISSVAFPLYSKLQDDLSKLKVAYFNVFKLSSFLSFPIAGLIFVTTPDLTMIFLGEKWMPMVPTMQVLVWWGVIRGLVGSMSPVFQSLGKPDITFKLQAVQTILLFSIIYHLTVNWDIYGTSLAVLLSALVMFFVRSYILVKFINCKYQDFIKPILFPFIFTIISLSIIYIIKLLFTNLTNLTSAILSIVIFIVAFGSLTFIVDKFTNYGIKTIIKRIKDVQ